MTTTPTNEDIPETADRTYGNWQRPPRGGLLNLGNSGTVAGALVLVATIIMFMLAGLLTGAVVGGVGLAMVALFSIQDRSGLSTFDRLSVRLSYGRARQSRTNLHRTVLTPEGSNTLPGLLGDVSVTEHVDNFGHHFALLAWPGEYYSVAWASSPDGAAGADNADIDRMVAYYGEWLAGQSSVPGLIGSSVIIETAPDTGGGLSRHIAETARPSASELSRTVMGEIARTYPEGSAEYRSYVTMTFTPKDRLPRIKNRAERVAAMADSLATDLADLVADMAHAGAGTLIPMDVQMLCEQVRVAYDPAVAADVDQARADGAAVQAMSWDSAGPVSYQSEWGHLVHDTGASVTFGMTLPPRQNVTASVLSKLTAPAQFARKRVALIYKVLPEEKAGAAAESGVSNAVFAQNASKKKTAKLSTALAAATLTAEEEAKGAGIVDFTVLATVTVIGTGEEQINRAATSLRNLSGTAKLRMRRLFGWQDAAFALTLPLGMQMDRHVAGPKFVKFFRGEN